MTTDADTAAVIAMINDLLNAAKDSTIIMPTNGLTAASVISGLTTGDHLVGTAMMGETNDGSGLVDTNTKVWGTDNLFVVDASIHPNLVSRKFLDSLGVIYMLT
jgi:cellobiose dehydrogenase (acceptor)